MANWNKRFNTRQWLPLRYCSIFLSISLLSIETLNLYAYNIYPRKHSFASNNFIFRKNENRRLPFSQRHLPVPLAVRAKVFRSFTSRITLYDMIDHRNEKKEDKNKNYNENERKKNPTTNITPLLDIVARSPLRSLYFSVIMTLCGAGLGPLLDSYHSLFGVLQYDFPVKIQLWSVNPAYPALVTTWWVPFLFGLAGFIIGWLTIFLDAYLQSVSSTTRPNPFQILTGISFFTFQYYLSGVLSHMHFPRDQILAIMSLLASFGFLLFDGSVSGFYTSVATAVGGPLIEVGLISSNLGRYHYIDGGETGFFPLWIVPVYFLGGPAVGNLARGIWNQLDEIVVSSDVSINDLDGKEGTAAPKPNCEYCNDTRVVGCPNCDAVGYYISYGKKVTCNCCRGKGLVICRDCFSEYDEDPNDIERIRDFMSRIPD